MKNLLIIRGPLGVGKTTISKNIAKRLNGIHICIDSVLERNNLDKIKGRCIPLKNFIKANDLIMRRVRAALEQGKTVVIDGNFYHKGQLTHLLRMAKDKTGVHGQVFTLKAPLNVCVKRDRTRKRSYGEHAAKAVHKLVSRFDHGKILNMGRLTTKQAEMRALSKIR